MPGRKTPLVINPANPCDSRHGLSRYAAGVVALLLAVAALGHAQEPQQPQSPEPVAPAPGTPKSDATFTVTGTVVDSVTGAPVRRAAVDVSDPIERATLTDSNGHFQFEKMPEGRVFISAMKPGFINQRGMSATVPLDVGPDMSPLLLRIAPAAVIQGRVTTRDGQPLEGLTVSAGTSQIWDGQKVWHGQRYYGRTDDRGEFRIANLPGGSYYVAVDQSQETRLTQPGIPNGREQSYAKTYYPGVSDLGAAALLEVHPGQQLEANFTLSGELLYRISGSAETGEVINSQLTFARKAGDGYDFVTAADAQGGKFQVRLPAGSYTATTSTASGREWTTGGPSVVVSSDAADLQVVLMPAASIKFVMRREASGAASSGSAAEDAHLRDAVSLQLVPTRVPGINQGVKWWNPRMDEIPNVEPGVYRAKFFSGGLWRVKAAQCGGVDLLTDDLTVTAGAQPPPVEITLSDDAATITGTLDTNIRPAIVLLVQRHGERNLIQPVPALQGSFFIQGVSPGDYELLAFDQTDPLEYENPEVLNPYLSKAVHVSVGPRETAKVDLHLSPLGR